ncbi:hypothetical protein HPB49_009178 [Dermacentor silvarum]|uniref:Uncharacterized protein n=1 Tax=Dermacentor silvarum TaxID=543639 RepID=A0ACB8CE93_DERSI|nr:hypothetical protein HPB49_009178 [Dermacentor silvarum]
MGSAEPTPQGTTSSAACVPCSRSGGASAEVMGISKNAPENAPSARSDRTYFSVAPDFAPFVGVSLPLERCFCGPLRRSYSLLATIYKVRRHLHSPAAASSPSYSAALRVRVRPRHSPPRHTASKLSSAVSKVRHVTDATAILARSVPILGTSAKCEESNRRMDTTSTEHSSPAVAAHTSAKRMTEPSSLPADGNAAPAAPKRFRSSQGPPPPPTHTPLVSPTTWWYKVLIKPRARYMSTLPNRTIQAALDACLEKSRFQGFALHKPTNTVSVWVPAMAVVYRLQELQQIQVSEECVLPVQAYLASGTDLRRYMVNGVDHDEEPEKLLQELSCPTHKVVAARYLSSGRTCLITLQGPHSPPERILYYGCVLRPRFKPSVVYCYSCFKQGHMKSSCPFPPKDDNMEPDPSAAFRCGLRQTNDGDITSPTCPTKLKAIKKAPQRRSRQQPSTSQGPSMKQVPVYNRSGVLALLQEDASQVTTASTATSDAAKPTGVPERQRASKSIEDTPSPLANEAFQIDARLATLEKEIQRLKERSSLLQRRHDGARASQSMSTSIPAHVVNPASMSKSLSPQELLRFVAQQLQHLTSVLVANLNL